MAEGDKFYLATKTELDAVEASIPAFSPQGQTLVNQTWAQMRASLSVDSSAEVDAKVAAASFSGDYGDLANVPATFAPSSHTHPQSEVTNLVSDLAGLDSRLDTLESAPSGSNPFVFEAELASNVSTGANTTPVDVTGLVFNYLANSLYVVEVFGSTQAAAATTGVGLQLNLSTAVTSCWGQFIHQLANTGTVTGGSTIADDASVGVSSGRPSTNTATPFYFSCLLKTAGNAGTAQLRIRSEVSAVATINGGTFMRVYKKT